MPIICPQCSYDRNAKDAHFCEACGYELVGNDPPPPPIYPEPPNYPEPPIYSEPPNYPEPPIYSEPPNYPEPPIYPEPPNYPEPPIYPEPPRTQTQTARLIPKQAGAPLAEFILDSSNALIGRFDPDTGPVEVDLDGFHGSETISRQHGEIYMENGQWKIKDLGSTNGIFIKPVGMTRFGARITTPQRLNSGDEIAIGKVRLLFQIP
ncbi:FHA domain-containing protein [Planktothricoides raciborskii]|uniref:FHA domain-containing protein n=1 Tax=Planktothricoides raciborskii FACHB-1370 TaxID=2949576 RepID=A0ABR8EDW2_9CYAN|nr:FHA domain-containing protein [Planktothricoides raciborskii]MBD2544512.1 FHA domain-containing protein [Planktothricoides raciborskii FACHB-1370]MBD2585233.1 FHA domain-containing protein [Planktothricoides raciborskii FACHB-1261]